MKLAAIILLIVVGLIVPTNLWYYDLSGNGSITAYDASLALRGVRPRCSGRIDLR